MSMVISESISLQSALFRELNADEKLHLLKLAKQEAYPAGEVILREGRQIQILWVVLKGECEVIKDLDGPREQCLATLEKGAVFGEMSFYDPAPHSASIRATTDVEVMRLSRENYETMLEKCPSAAYKIAAAMVQVLADRLRRLDEHVQEVFAQEKSEKKQEKQREEWSEFRAKLLSEWKF